MTDLPSADTLSPPPPDPECVRQGDDVWLTWPTLKVAMMMTAFHAGSEGLHAEVVVESRDLEIHWGRLNLVSTSSREGLVKKLSTIDPLIPWRPMLERACRLTALEVRRSDPAVALIPRLQAGERYVVNPIWPRHEPTVLYGDGGAGKGWLATLCAYAVAKEGLPLPSGFTVGEHGPVLYLDWEATREDLEERLYFLGDRGDGGLIHYRHMSRSLADEAPSVRADMSRLQACGVIVDSWGPACGPEPESADATTRAFAALRTLKTSSLIVAHVNRVQADQKTGAARPFGSVFVANLARCTWEMRQSEEADDELLVSLFNRKRNRGRKHSPITLRYAFSNDAMRVSAASLADAPDLLARTSLPQQLLALLARGPRTAADLAEELNAKLNSIVQALKRLLARGKVVHLPDARWALPTRREE